MSIHSLKPLLMHPRALTTTDTTSTFFSDQSLFWSLFKFWYFSIFLISFSRILKSPGTATSMMMHDFVFLSIKIKLGVLASITLSHWIFISQINLTSSCSTAPSGQCLYHVSFLSRLCFLHSFQWTNFVTVSCLLLRCSSFLHSHIISYTVSPVLQYSTQWISDVLTLLFFL